MIKKNITKNSAVAKKYTSGGTSKGANRRKNNDLI